MLRFYRFLSVFMVLLFAVGCVSTDDTVTLPTDADDTLPVQASPSVVGQKVFYGDAGGDTLTGLCALPPFAYTVADPDNTAQLSETAVDHYFGKAENGEVHRYSRSFQETFDSKKMDAIVYDTRTDKKRIYLTFDCGYENGNTEKILDTLKEKQVPAAFFCTLHEIESSPDLIVRMINEGHIVGNHSVTHADFSGISRTQMAQEIVGFDTYLRKNFGYSSLFFRFPEGRYNDSAIQLANSLGFTCVFWSAAYSDWDTAKQKGADHAFSQVTKQLHPGMILLLHSVSSDNAEAMGDIIDYARANGYEFCSLEEL